MPFFLCRICVIFFPKIIMSGTTSTITLNETSARKVFSHALSHPHADVSGALLCSSSSNSSNKNDNNNNNKLEIVDAMPLFHCESIDCAAMNEIALTQVQKYAKTREMRICGVYFAGGNFNNNNENDSGSFGGGNDLLPNRAKGLADAIGKANASEGGGGGDEQDVQCLLLDAGKLKPFLDAIDSKNVEFVAAPFRVFNHGSNYNSNNGGELKERANAFVRCSNAFVLPSSSERGTVYDFDDHFDDIGKDWRNDKKE
jgi:hypothetical protein